MVIAEGTPERVLTALKLYLAIAPRRSLRRLVDACREAGIKASLPSLQRWSTRYRWQDAVVEHERRVAQKLSEALEAQYNDVVEQQLGVMLTLHKRFRDWMQVDARDPSLTAAQRRRAFSPSLKDYERFLRIEDMLLERWLKLSREAPSGGASESMGELSPEETIAVLRARSRMRYNLPIEPGTEQ